ncbi:hypothetical protein CRE_17455 [Caenorhabditis remanei]|uniref:DUF38 domain-containing protein n=1 Tax=Caenorhabditis remanei TaxID=31234 RepID=E3N243_CAERE|nr:hypothetical protein CRE_17455 [Caenorhabditis remanei]
MPLSLSYPGLRCVLEHLEAVKRAHVIARAPGLQKIDKLIPLCLKNLCIDSDEMTINKLLIEYDKDEVKFEMKWKNFSRKQLASRKNKMKKLINFYIYGRSIIHVGNLTWNESSLPDFLPVGMKFRVNSLTALLWQFDAAIPFVDSCSFPLKTMATIPKPSTFDSQIVQLAETLILHVFTHRIVTVEDLKKLNNKTVAFECVNYSRIDIVPLIKYHVETKKDIGKTLVIATYDKDFLSEKLGEFEKAFGEYRSDLDGVNERFLPGSSKFCIPINNECRIQVYAIEDPEEDGRYKLIVKPVPEIS